MIKFETVSIKYVNDFYCLYNYNYNIESNTLFIGDEYVGTSSIMRLIAKIDKSYTGNIIIDNVNIKNLKNKDLDVAYVPYEPELFLHKSLEYNLSFPLKIRKINKNTIKTTVNSAISKYNLKNFSKKVHHLSASEKKIITLVRAILRKPKYLLVENLFENLDETYINLAIEILEDAKEFSTIIACENDKKFSCFFKNFNVINLEKNTAQ